MRSTKKPARKPVAPKRHVASAVKAKSKKGKEKMSKTKTSSRGLVLAPHPLVEPPVNPTDAAVADKHAEMRRWMREEGLEEQANKNWSGPAWAFLAQTPDPTNEKPATLEVARKNLAHGEGPAQLKRWWGAGGTSDNPGEGDVPEPPTPPSTGYADEPPPTDPEFAEPVDMATRYPENAKWRQLKAGEEHLAIPRSSYQIQWAGPRISPVEWKQRFEQAALQPEPNITPRMWKLGWDTFIQGFDLKDPFGQNAGLRQAVAGMEPEQWVAKQIELASGGGPSGG
jgi:hypothetical protein